MKRKLLYIAGMGHNGSTILDLLLGESEKTVSTSQLNDLWSRYEPKVERRFSDAAWVELLSYLSDDEKAHLRAANLSVLHEGRLLQFLFRASDRLKYAEANKPLLNAVFAKWPDHLIVDSSKNISRALGLLELKDLDFYCLHLVRDVRSYINSENSRRRKKGLRRSYLPGTIIWAAKNWAASIFLKRRARHYLLMRYEDFVVNPVNALRELECWVGHDFEGARACLEGMRPIGVSTKPVFSGNRILVENEVFFQPSTNTETPLHRSRLFWVLLGWVSMPYRYRRREL